MVGKALSGKPVKGELGIGQINRNVHCHVFWTGKCRTRGRLQWGLETRRNNRGGGCFSRVQGLGPGPCVVEGIHSANRKWSRGTYSRLSPNTHGTICASVPFVQSDPWGLLSAGRGVWGRSGGPGPRREATKRLSPPASSGGSTSSPGIPYAVCDAETMCFLPITLGASQNGPRVRRAVCCCVVFTQP